MSQANAYWFMCVNKSSSSATLSHINTTGAELSYINGSDVVALDHSRPKPAFGMAYG